MTLKRLFRRTMLIFIVIASPLLIFTAVLLTSQSARLWAITMISEGGIKVEKNIRYGSEARHKLDIYTPDTNNTSGPIVVFYYGGGWTSGSKDLYHFLGAAFAKKGITTVIPDYRLFPDVKFPVFVEDSALAYSWVWNKFVKGRQNKRPIIVIGHSAGAHIAAFLSYNKNYLSSINPEITRPAGFVGLAGPYAFDATTWPTTKDIFNTAKSADDARPIAFVDESSPSTLLFHGSKDTVVRLWNAEDLNKKLKANNVESDLEKLDGIGHLGVVTSIVQPLRWRAPVLEKTINFVNRFSVK